jgi:hypothetical protein
LLTDRPPPTAPTTLRLKFPLEEMGDKHGHAAGELALFALAHVLNLLGNVLDVESIEVPPAQQSRLLLGPSDDIGFVARAHGVYSPPQQTSRRRTHCLRRNQISEMPGA